MRATGRTFRMLLKAIIAASEAKQDNVLTVVGCSENHVMDMYKGASGILGSYIHSDGLIFNSRKKTIEIVGAGIVKFRKTSDFDHLGPQERDCPNLFIDHHVSY